MSNYAQNSRLAPNFCVAVSELGGATYDQSGRLDASFGFDGPVIYSDANAFTESTETNCAIYSSITYRKDHG